MKNLFTIIAASLLLGTASMAAEHTEIDNNSAYLDLRPNGTTLRTTAADARIVVCNVMGSGGSQHCCDRDSYRRLAIRTLHCPSRQCGSEICSEIGI